MCELDAAKKRKKRKQESFFVDIFLFHYIVSGNHQLKAHGLAWRLAEMAK